jgi:hypothetical protein
MLQANQRIIEFFFLLRNLWSPLVWFTLWPCCIYKMHHILGNCVIITNYWWNCWSSLFKVSFHNSWILTSQRGAMIVIIWYLDLQLHVHLVPITTKFVSLNPAHGKVYSIQHYVIKFVSDLYQVCNFLRVLQFPPPKKMTIWKWEWITDKHGWTGSINCNYRTQDKNKI